MDPFLQWLEALDARHLEVLSFQEVRRAVQALSSLYVERRNRLGQGSALDGSGKRAAFATYFAPLHFLLVREIVRSLNAAQIVVDAILDMGCGTGVAGAAWASEILPHPHLVGIEQNPWAVHEAKWTWDQWGIKGVVRKGNFSSARIPAGSAVIAAFALNELPEDVRTRYGHDLLAAAKRGSPVLIVEPIARRLNPWWADWAKFWVAAGAREDEWRIPVQLPAPLARMDKAAGLNHRELTARSLYFSQATSGKKSA